MKRVTPIVSKLRGLCMVAACAAIAFGCAPDSFDNFKELDTVLTLRDPDYTFKTNRTYAMPDEVIDISENLENAIERDTSNDEAILAQVATEMENFGYERIDDLDDPGIDVFVAVGGVTEENVTWGSYYSYWGRWYGYYWYYPITTVAITYPVGSLLIHMVDEDGIDTDLEEIAPVWSAGLRGFGTTRAEADARSLVKQAFTQSQYLRVDSTTNAVLGGEL